MGLDGRNLYHLTKPTDREEHPGLFRPAGQFERPWSGAPGCDNNYVGTFRVAELRYAICQNCPLQVGPPLD